MLFVIPIILTIIFLGTFIIVFFFSCFLPVLRGAPFVPVHKKRLERALELIELNSNRKAVDLGSGNGRILLAVAKKGAKATGFELNPFLVWQTKWRVRKAGLQDLASCKWRSFWRQDISSFDLVFVYGISHIMKYLERKFERELKPGAQVVSFVFSLPSWQPLVSENGIYVYQK